MTKPSIFIAAATAFALGYGLDLLIERSWPNDGKQIAFGERPITKSKRSDRPPFRGQKSKDLLREMLDSDFEGQRGRLDDLDPGDFPALLEAFSARAGYTGLTREDQNLLWNMVTSWSAKDKEAALRWALALEGGRDRFDMLGAVVEGVSTENLEEGLLLLEDLRQNYGENPYVSRSLLAMAVGQDAASLLRLCQYPESDVNNLYFPPSQPMEFAEDFDFKSAMDGFDEYTDILPKTELPVAPLIPKTTLQEWAKRDPQAAMDWLLLEKRPPLGISFSAITGGYAETSSDADVVALISDYYESGGNHSETLRALMAPGSEAVIRGFLNKAPEGAERGQVIQRLLNSSRFEASPRMRTARSLLLRQMDSQQRIEYFSGRNRGRDLGYENGLRDELKILGHTPEEIDGMTK